MSIYFNQASMEFLLTYGWAIVIVVIGVSALWYYGLLDIRTIGSAVMPPSCFMESAGISCLDHSVTYVPDPIFPELSSNSLFLRVKNNLGTKITINGIAIPQYDIEPDEEGYVGYQWENGQGNGPDDPVIEIRQMTKEQPAMKSGESYTIDFTLKVTNEETKLPHYFKGTITGKVN